MCGPCKSQLDHPKRAIGEWLGSPLSSCRRLLEANPHPEKLWITMSALDLRLHVWSSLACRPPWPRRGHGSVCPWWRRPRSCLRHWWGAHLLHMWCAIMSSSTSVKKVTSRRQREHRGDRGWPLRAEPPPAVAGESSGSPGLLTFCCHWWVSPTCKMKDGSTNLRDVNFVA
jgi:hypothetical protein